MAHCALGGRTAEMSGKKINSWEQHCCQTLVWSRRNGRQTESSLPWNTVSTISHWWDQTFPSIQERAVMLSRWGAIVSCCLGCCWGCPGKRCPKKWSGCHLVALSQLSHAVEKMEMYGWLLVFYPRKIFWKKLRYILCFSDVGIWS